MPRKPLTDERKHVLRVEKMQKAISEARTIFQCMSYMQIVTPETMSQAISKFIRDTE